MPSVKDFFNRGSSSALTVSVPTVDRLLPQALMTDVRVLRIEAVSQAEVACRTIGTSTVQTELREAMVATESFACVDRTTETDLRSIWDVSVQASCSSTDASVDPGDWNNTVLRGIDSQTDCQDPMDPLFWLSGSSDQLTRLFAQLIQGLEREELRCDTTQEVRDNLNLRAENVLLRVEVETLKRRISQAEGSRRSMSPAMDSRRVHRGTVSAVTVGSPFSASFIVTRDEGLVVTSSLAPSSAPLGRLNNGDKVFTAGGPEEICGLVRGPILPRGWITLRDSEHTYLRKSA